MDIKYFAVVLDLHREYNDVWSIGFLDLRFDLKTVKYCSCIGIIVPKAHRHRNCGYLPFWPNNEHLMQPWMQIVYPFIEIVRCRWNRFSEEKSRPLLVKLRASFTRQKIVVLQVSAHCCVALLQLALACQTERQRRQYVVGVKRHSVIVCTTALVERLLNAIKAFKHVLSQVKRLLL